jgi:GTP:adenosylcobinamide-phosphate guanylyltransferase
MKAVVAAGSYPVLITTGDHALLTPEMVNYVCNMSQTLNADMTVGLATRETISAGYPETKRTYFQFGDHAVSGCNLFTIHNREGLRLLEAWARIDKDRKKPWKLAFAFGPVALFKLLTRRMTLDEAFAIVSRTCNMTVRPLLLPFAEAAIDVDKPADKELAEQILAKRRAKT